MEGRVLQMIASPTPEERLRMASSMFTTGRKLIEAGLLRRNSSLNRAQIRAQTFLRLYGQGFSDAEVDRIMKSIPDMQLDKDR